MTRQERALRRLAARRSQELDRADVDLLIGVAAARLAGVTALPEQPGLETVSPAYFERLSSAIEKLLSARDNWIGA
jgi:hypothetical protein